VQHVWSLCGARPVGASRVQALCDRRVWSFERRVRSNGEARPVTATALSDTCGYSLSCSDRTRPVTLTSVSGHHVFHCDDR
jgi:hypothetical protein